ncbi:universal stress protein [Azotobacter vinelandii]
MHRLLQRLDALGIQAKAQLLKGKPSSEIARHAQERDASLIVVGKHGQNWLASTVIGSTAANLCEIAGRPALMVP